MDERLKFVARLLDGEKMAVLCREFEISRKTGYKIYTRYKDCGVEGLTDRSRRPYRHARQLPFQIEKAIVQLKQEHPSWGAPKIRERLRRKHSEVHCPAISTVHAILDRNGLVKRRRRRVYKPEGTALAHPHHPNDLWCADYKGEFMLADRRYCYPLTITDLPAATCSAVRGSRAPWGCTHSPCSNAFSRTLGSPERFEPITALPLPARTPSLASPNSRSGGCDSGSTSSASSPVILSKTVAMSACI
jgi:putative transposase